MLSITVLFVFSCASLISSYIVPSKQIFTTARFMANQWTEESISSAAYQSCQAAGIRIIKGSNSISLQDDIISKIGSRDIVTKVDLEVQEIIQATILKNFPDHKFLGEEDVLPGMDASKKATEEYLSQSYPSFWICDPIDGTTNFAHGMPLSGIILAFVSKGELVYGMIHDPFRNETFTAWKGKGAYLNGHKSRCCKTRFMKDSVICTGSPPNLSALNACLRATNLISKDVRTMRMLGSASIMTSWLACGRVTSYFEADLNLWDIAAGALIISEAGGRITDVYGNPYTLATRNIVATNGVIHDELLPRLQEARMWLE